MNLLVGGAPSCQWRREKSLSETPYVKPHNSVKELILKVLAHPDIARKDWVYEQYDHDVQLRTVSIGSDAAIIRLGSRMLALSCGCNPRHIFLAPYEGTANAVLENTANLVTKGAIPLCIVNCLNFASPVHSHIMWQLEQCIRGLGEMARKINVPVVGGNVSLYNESDEMGTQIKPTPSIGIVGKANSFSTLSPSDGDELALIGRAGSHLGGSILDAVINCGGSPPPIGDTAILEPIRLLVEKRLLTGIVDISNGGLISAMAEMVPRCKVHLDGDIITELFSETYGRFLGNIV
jgi:phosphoribosylformylglycinamidine synthase